MSPLAMEITGGLSKTWNVAVEVHWVLMNCVLVTSTVYMPGARFDRTNPPGMVGEDVSGPANH